MGETIEEVRGGGNWAKGRRGEGFAAILAASGREVRLGRC
jgi:hypothetical protein